MENRFSSSNYLRSQLMSIDCWLKDERRTVDGENLQLTGNRSDIDNSSPKDGFVGIF